MTTETPVEVIANQDWLAPVEEGLQKAVGGAFSAAGPAGRAVKNFLHGVWLGHPLHPALTDIPIGAWTAAAVLDIADATGTRNCAGAADAALKVGLAGAVAAAAAGLTDWQATDGEARRVGITHGLLNLTGTVLYTTSMLLRSRRRRDAARVLSFAGYAVALTSAWLGGKLVYSMQIGVNHTAGEPLPHDFVAVLRDEELPEDQLRRVEAGGVKVLLVRRNGSIRAIAEVCSHLGGPLAEGQLEGDSVRCPWHGSAFALDDGRVLDGPATHPQPCFETRVRNGLIEIRAPRR